MAYTTIKKPSDYFNTNLWTGAGGSSKTISGNNFQPDLVWTKRRNAIGSHKLYDAVRGITKDLSSDNTNPETTASGSGYLNAFNSDGFTLVQGSSDNYYVDASGVTYASWSWKANNTTAANTDGSISSTVSANTTSGFSIVKWTSTDTAGSTIGHGLGSIPKMIITKKITSGNPGNWTVYHNSIGNTKSIALNTTGAEDAAISYWNNTSPTSSVFSTGTYFDAGDYIAYCFAEKQGFSKFGSYTGGGSNFPFIYTGFKPAFIMFKDTGYASNWCMFDNRRAGYNSKSDILAPNTSGAEDASNTTFADFLSNGFKWRFTNADFNASGNNYIYMAFAEEPLVGDNPATAR